MMSMRMMSVLYPRLLNKLCGKAFKDFLDGIISVFLGVSHHPLAEVVKGTYGNIAFAQILYPQGNFVTQIYIKVIKQAFIR